MTRYTLQRLVMPTTEFADNTRLFVNKYEKYARILSENSNLIEYKFNTWMNMFAASKWDKYCDLGNIYLRLNIVGKYKVQVIGSVRNAALGIIDTVITEKEINSLDHPDNVAEILVPNATKYEGVYFSVFTPQNSLAQIIDGAWCTDKEANVDNKLAIVTCTFKREDFITKTISKFENFISENPELEDKIKLYVVDNGKSLDISKSNDRVTIFHNINAGGAGGFTRGLMEVIRSGKAFTRVLFMDDDVNIFPDSFFRTLIISNYLKEEFKNSIINGAMLDIYRKDRFFENLAIQNKLWVSPYKCNLSLDDYNNILNINDTPDEIFQNPDAKVASAWWYCCFDLNFHNNKGLPLPLFIRGDDTEWSWRQFGTHHISINGICIWHAPFEWRVSTVADYYYLPRNMFMLNSLYTSDFESKFEGYFKERFNYLIKTYDYNSIEILFRAMDDILKGSDIFRENPEEQFRNVSSIAKKIKYFHAEHSELETAKHYHPRIKKLHKKLYSLTKRGLNCPKFLMKKNDISLEWYPPAENFILRREVRVYNLFTSKYCVRKFEKEKIINYEKEFSRRLDLMKKNYSKLHEDYKQAYKEFTTFEFWENYLDIKIKNENRVCV